MPSTATIVEVSGRTFDVPLDCPCCGDTPDAELAIPLARDSRDRAADSAVSVDFPYCRRCVTHVALSDSVRIVLSGLCVIGVLAFVVAAIASEPGLGFGILVALVALGAVIATTRRSRARQARQPSCSSIGRAVTYLGWSGTATGLAFDSMSYGAKFAERNATVLVDNARIRKLLEHYKLARIAVPTPAAAVAVIPPPVEVGEWIARLASASSRVGRRAGLATALKVLHEPREREQLVRAVYAIELAPHVAMLDRLPSTAAKRRYLRTTIAQVRRDNVPEPLQQALLRELEQRLDKV